MRLKVVLAAVCVPAAYSSVDSAAGSSSCEVGSAVAVACYPGNASRAMASGKVEYCVCPVQRPRRGCDTGSCGYGGWMAAAPIPPHLDQLLQL